MCQNKIKLFLQAEEPVICEKAAGYHGNVCDVRLVETEWYFVVDESPRKVC